LFEVLENFAVHHQEIKDAGIYLLTYVLDWVYFGQ